MTAGGGRRSATGDLRELAGRVLGVDLRGRLPAGFAPFLGPASAGASTGTGRLQEPGGAGIPLRATRAVSPGAARGELRLDLTWKRVEALPAVPPIWQAGDGGDRDPAQPWSFSLFLHDGGIGLAVGGAAEGRILFGVTEATLEWKDGEDAAAHLFFAYALPLWLESRGVPVLHGGAVVPGGAAVGFLAPTGTGKSTLCAGLVELGCGFLADDGLALLRHPDGGWACPPGVPLLRLWPSALARRPELETRALPAVAAEGGKRRVPAGAAVRGGAPPVAPSGDGRSGDVPLAALYVLRRRPGAAGPVRVSRLDPRRALVELLEHGVAAAPAAALGLAATRFGTLAEVAAAVPVWRLKIPSSPDAAERVLRILEAGPPDRGRTGR